ncbi:MAG TPA: phosphatidate cytidylyltransferase, partial [Solirubrobacteraceae bacterium]
FAVPLALIGALGHGELARMRKLVPAAALPGMLGVAAAPLAAELTGDRAGPAIAVAAALGLAPAAAAALSPAPARRTAAATTALGVAWLGLTLGHAVLLRDLPHGIGLVIDVLLATFLGDTAAQLAGSAWGRRKLAPSISPNKTVEGLAAGILVGTAAVVVAALAFEDAWLSAVDALALGLACALAAPAGDLFESRLKRRAGVKDSGGLFGAHGGVLDRADAVIAAALAGYYVAIAVT